jgi:hypothetical protein
MFAGAKAEGGKEVVTQAKGIPPYCLDVELMASGEQYLVLTKQVRGKPSTTTRRQSCRYSAEPS